MRTRARTFPSSQEVGMRKRKELLKQNSDSNSNSSAIPDSSFHVQGQRFVLCTKDETCSLCGEQTAKMNSEEEGKILSFSARLDNLVIANEANSKEHWAKKMKRHHAQKMVVNTRLGPYRGQFRTPCEIILTRIAPRKLDDHDNLPMSFKYLLDAVCDNITPGLPPGRADDAKYIKKVTYLQIKGIPKQYSVHLEIKAVA